MFILLLRIPNRFGMKSSLIFWTCFFHYLFRMCVCMSVCPQAFRALALQRVEIPQIRFLCWTHLGHGMNDFALDGFSQLVLPLKIVVENFTFTLLFECVSAGPISRFWVGSPSMTLTWARNENSSMSSPKSKSTFKTSLLHYFLNAFRQVRFLDAGLGLPR